ncbi:hypothetical protein SAMN02787144_103527 [Streptomyces atratus]|uniref:Uncharacterized protein n=1 Tax=Streptomyces atratus TaxID=1893 RepID=A0A1K2F7A9_STRAR|nr:hypothetical protein SAMN02787144_103527 [Streptomyces atratus]
MLQLAAMLDPNGIPAPVLTAPAALDYLTEHRTPGQEPSTSDSGRSARRTHLSQGVQSICVRPAPTRANIHAVAVAGECQDMPRLSEGLMGQADRTHPPGTLHGHHHSNDLPDCSSCWTALDSGLGRPVRRTAGRKGSRRSRRSSPESCAGPLPAGRTERPAGSCRSRLALLLAVSEPARLDPGGRCAGRCGPERMPQQVGGQVQEVAAQRGGVAGARFGELPVGGEPVALGPDQVVRDGRTSYSD